MRTEGGVAKVFVLPRMKTLLVGLLARLVFAALSCPGGGGGGSEEWALRFVGVASISFGSCKTTNNRNHVVLFLE